MNRTAVTGAKRIVLKVGSSSLTGSAGSALDASAVASSHITQVTQALHNEHAFINVIIAT